MNGTEMIRAENGGGNMLAFAANNFKGMLDFAGSLVKTGFLPTTIKTSEQALAIILTGQELGISPMQALRQINVIQGKPTLAAELMLALAKKRVGLVVNVIESTALRCSIEFIRPGHKPYTHIFTMEEATKLGLNGKDNWVKQAATMLRWRCISAALRIVAPEVVMGVCNPEEMAPDAKIDYETGEILEVPYTSAPCASPAETAPPVPPSSAPARGDELITEKQGKRLYAIASEFKVEGEKVKAFLMEKYNIDSSSKILKRDYEAITDWLLLQGSKVQ